MSTNFPSSVDAFTNPTSGDTLDNPPHDQQHADINDAMEAVQTALLDGSPLKIDDANNRVGINDTTPSYTLDVNGDINATGDLRIGGTAVGAWTSYTPTLTNWTASTIDFKYAVVNGLVIVRVYAVVSTMGSFPRFSLPSGYPVTNGYPNFQTVGLLDSGSTWYQGIILGHSTTEMNVMCVVTTGTFAGYYGISSTTPLPWAAGDAVDGMFYYGG